jgi:hypothetical protein
VRTELTELFGGTTTFIRAPAQGDAKSAAGLVRDDIVVFEVMASEIDRI